MATTIDINELLVAYGGQPVVKGVSFSVPAGALCVLVGPSGSGKTTILRAITGYAPIQAGTVKIGDRVVNNIAPGERDIAMVFQGRALYPHMTVWENWAFPLEAIRRPAREIKQRVLGVAEMLQMTPFLERYPRELSGGQQQRVALGRAIIRRPQVFLMDEPLSGLDAKLRVETRSHIKRLHQDLGVTTVYVTHDQVEAQALGSLIVVLNEGAVQQVGTPAEIYARPASRFVAGFVGNPPMNLLECELHHEDGAFFLQQGAHRFHLPPRLQQVVAARARGAAILLGIRPEDARLSLVPRPESLPAEIYVTEPQGHQLLVDLRVGDLILKLRGEREVDVPSNLDTNDRVWLTFAMERVHLFDAQSGVRLN